MKIFLFLEKHQYFVQFPPKYYQIENLKSTIFEYCTIQKYWIWSFKFKIATIMYVVYWYQRKDPKTTWIHGFSRWHYCFKSALPQIFIFPLYTLLLVIFVNWFEATQMRPSKGECNNYIALSMSVCTDCQAHFNLLLVFYILLKYLL